MWFSPLEESDNEAEVCRELLTEFDSQSGRTLERPSFSGCGVYALYYHGDLPLYEEISNDKSNLVTPIYVGKASPPGGRKGARGVDYSAEKLAERITDHYDSIQEAENLRTHDFSYKVLRLKKPWIRFAEESLIDRFLPWWNRYVDGLGNHDVGAGREGSQQSLWDMFHPGRGFVQKRALVPRGNPKEVWYNEIAPKMKDDGKYETQSFPGMEAPVYDPQTETTPRGNTDINRFF